MSYCYPRNNNCPFNLPKVENSFSKVFIISSIAQNKCYLLINRSCEGFYKMYTHTLKDPCIRACLHYYIGIRSWGQ